MSFCTHDPSKQLNCLACPKNETVCQFDEQKGGSADYFYVELQSFVLVIQKFVLSSHYDNLSNLLASMKFPPKQRHQLLRTCNKPPASLETCLNWITYLLTLVQAGTCDTGAVVEVQIHVAILQLSRYSADWKSSLPWPRLTGLKSMNFHYWHLMQT
jgi:hypothetical protein